MLKPSAFPPLNASAHALNCISQLLCKAAASFTNVLPLTEKGRAESPLLVTGGAAIPPSAEVEEPAEDEVAGDVLLEAGTDDDVMESTLFEMLEAVVLDAFAAEKEDEADFIELAEELATGLVLSGPAATALAAKAAAA